MKVFDYTGLLFIWKHHIISFLITIYMSKVLLGNCLKPGQYSLIFEEILGSMIIAKYSFINNFNTNPVVFILMYFGDNLMWQNVQFKKFARIRWIDNSFFLHLGVMKRNRNVSFNHNTLNYFSIIPNTTNAVYKSFITLKMLFYNEFENSWIFFVIFCCICNSPNSWFWDWNLQSEMKEFFLHLVNWGGKMWQVEPKSNYSWLTMIVTLLTNGTVGQVLR